MAVIELTAANFEKEAIAAQEKVLIDFWASWCGPCKMLSPIIDEIAEEGHANLKVCKINVDNEPELATVSYTHLSRPVCARFFPIHSEK